MAVGAPVSLSKSPTRGLACLANPDREMPLECVTMAELKAMLAYRRHQDSMKAEKAAENAKKKRRKK